MSTDTTETTEPAEEQKALVRRAAAQFATNKIDIADLWKALAETPENKRVERVAPKTSELTAEEKAALSLLPDIFGKVVPKTPRLLTAPEAKAIVEEREIIDLLLAVLKKRKDEAIRETLANHCDLVLEAEYKDDPDALLDFSVDDKGHYQIKQEVSVAGTGRKIQKTVSEPKRTLTAAAVLEAHEAGKIDRKTFLKITRVPDVPRELDEDGLAKAIKADPSLLFTLSPITTQPSKTTTIKVAKDT